MLILLMCLKSWVPFRQFCAFWEVPQMLSVSLHPKLGLLSHQILMPIMRQQQLGHKDALQLTRLFLPLLVRAAYRCWAESLDIVLGMTDALHTWRRELRGEEDISRLLLERCGLWGCLMGGVLASNIAQLVLRLSAPWSLHSSCCFCSLIFPISGLCAPCCFCSLISLLPGVSDPWSFHTLVFLIPGFLFPGLSTPWSFCSWSFCPMSFLLLVFLLSCLSAPWSLHSLVFLLSHLSAPWSLHSLVFLLSCLSAPWSLHSLVFLLPCLSAPRSRYSLVFLLSCLSAPRSLYSLVFLLSCLSAPRSLHSLVFSSWLPEFLIYTYTCLSCYSFVLSTFLPGSW